VQDFSGGKFLHTSEAALAAFLSFDLRLLAMLKFVSVFSCIPAFHGFTDFCTQI